MRRNSLTLFTQSQCIISAALFRQFSADVCSFRAKQLHLKVELLFNSCRKPALPLLKRRDGDFMIMMSVCFQGVSQVSSCQSEPADSLQSYGCCCNVQWLRSWLTKHPGKWQSYVFISKLHNYIITISKVDAVCHCRRRADRHRDNSNYINRLEDKQDDCRII